MFVDCALSRTLTGCLSEGDDVVGMSGFMGWKRVLGRTLLIAVIAGGAIGLDCERARADQPGAFTVANYPVDAQAKNAVVAKKMAIEAGQQSAFRSMLKRIVPVSVYSRLGRVKAENAANYISGMSVRSEQNSSTEYLANLDFVFNADATRSLLRREGIPFIDEPAAPTTLVPVYYASSKVAPLTRLGAWGATWQGLDLKNTITPLKLSALQSSVHGDTLKMLEDGDTSALRLVSGEYGTGPVVMAFAWRDNAAKRFHVTLVGRDSVGPLVLKRSYRMSDGDVAYAMEFAAVVSLGILEGRWKATRVNSRGGVALLSGPGVPVSVQVVFQNPGQWYQIQQRLTTIEGVQDFRVVGVSARSADVALTFPGGGNQLANVLAREGLTLRSDGGVWVLRSSY